MMIGGMSARRAAHLRRFAQKRCREDGPLVIATAGHPRTMAPPLDQQVAQGSLRALRWQRAHGSIGHSRNKEAADCITRSWGKLRARCAKPSGPRLHEQLLLGRELRLVELTAQLIGNIETCLQPLEDPKRGSDDLHNAGGGAGPLIDGASSSAAPPARGVARWH